MSKTTAPPPRTSHHDLFNIVVDTQLEHLDETDYYASAWADAVRNHAQASGSKKFIKWGGRGKGGKQMARKTYQPKDIIMDHVQLEYYAVADASGGVPEGIEQNVTAKQTLLLHDATIKLLHGHVYAMIGTSGCGKSSLLRRMASGKIPGFPPHIATLYISQEMITLDTVIADDKKNNTIHSQGGLSSTLTPLEFVRIRYQEYVFKLQGTSRSELEQLEFEMEQLNVDTEVDQAKLEKLVLYISELEDEIENSVHEETSINDDDGTISNAKLLQAAQEALQFMGIPASLWSTPIQELSESVLKKVSLAVALAVARHNKIDLLLLDEPTSGLDIPGLLRLREMISILANDFNKCSLVEVQPINDGNSSSMCSSTILFVSHDVDFINSVATDIIEFYQQSLHYYSGNYVDYAIIVQQNENRRIKTLETIDRKRQNMKQTISNLRKKKNTRRQIESHKKKLSREIMTDYNTTDAIQKSSGTGTTTYSNAIRRSFVLGTEPDKAYQFVFRQVSSKWHDEPLIMAIDVGHGFNVNNEVLVNEASTTNKQPLSTSSIFPKKNGYLLDCVDLCIEEGHVYCIMGENSCGKSTLLKLLAKQDNVIPLEGKVIHAHNVEVAFIDQHNIDSLIMLATDSRMTNADNDNSNKPNQGKTISSWTALEYLTNKHPTKTGQEIRSELTSFGLSTPNQVSGIPISFLSGGERRRLYFANVMLSNPHVLIVDEPTNNLDVESVHALIYGLSNWDGTLVVASHDLNFIRSLDARCYVIVPYEGKLRRVDCGIDSYLKSFATTTTGIEATR